VQTDGRILVGGQFTMLAGQTCNYLGRLHPEEPSTVVSTRGQIHGSIR
jgi:hypothetical protein